MAASLPNLAKRYGGSLDVKTYCRYYTYRPDRLWKRLLCSGGTYWEPCEDFWTCLRNPPHRPVIRVSRPVVYNFIVKVT